MSKMEQVIELKLSSIRCGNELNENGVRLRYHGGAFEVPCLSCGSDKWNKIAEPYAKKLVLQSLK